MPVRPIKNPYREVAIINSFLAYLGGKSKLADRIIPLIPDHHCYVEVFAGAAWLLFKKEESRVEVINDINKDLVTLYRVIKYHLDEFVRYFRWALVSREEFERLKTVPPETMTDIQRSARIYYILKSGFGAKLKSPAFSSAPSSPPRMNLLRIEQDLSDAHMRLARVYIELLPFEKALARFDRDNTFFYLDPPYYGCENDYGKGVFCRDDFERLNQLLSALKGKFILSLNDRPEVRSIFSGFHIRTVKTAYSATNKGAKQNITEVLISNIKLRSG